MIRGIHHVAINTANFDRIIEFYRRAFGFEPVGEEFSWRDSAFVDSVVGLNGSAARTMMLKADNAYLEVFEYSSPPAREAGPLRPCDRGYTHFCVDTDDIENDFQKLIEAGMTFGRALPDGAGGIRAVYGKDPDGNVIELQQLQPGHVFELKKLRGASLTGSGSARPAWRAVMDELQKIDSVIDGVAHPEDEEAVAKAVLHGLLLISQGYLLNVACNAYEPRWHQNYNWPHPSLGNCPDTTYFFTALDAKCAYRIWGKRNTIHMVDVQIGEAFYGTEKGGTSKALKSVDLDGPLVGADGGFNFILSPQKPADWAGDWIEMPATAEAITLRQVAYDWINEREAEIHIERIDNGYEPDRNALETLKGKIRAISVYGRIMADFQYGVKYQKGSRSRGAINDKVEILDFSDAGGLANQYYFSGAFDLAPDQALVIEIEVPSPCRYWNIQLSDEMNGSLDYIFRHSSLNGHQASVDPDGRVRVVLAHKDPGVANWLDVCGYRAGLFMGRWREAARMPQQPVAKLVPFDSIASALPPETKRVSPAERQAQMLARRNAMFARLRI